MISEPPESFSDKFYEGIEQFNRQEFFECHETLEQVWHERCSPDRIFIQGIIQIAVGCHHLKQRNTKGSYKLFENGLQKLEPFKPIYAGLNLESLVIAINNLKQQTLTSKIPVDFCFPILTVLH